MSLPRLQGTLRVPSDKSITQRAILLAAIARGTSVLEEPLRSADSRAVLRAVAHLGARCEESSGGWQIRGVAPGRLRHPQEPLDLENSGTGVRLLLGLLAGQGVAAHLTGDASLQRRPMARVVQPLQSMGARFTGEDLEHLPLRLQASSLRPFQGRLELASAQVKSAVLLAALGAAGRSEIALPAPSRDHTERLLPLFGVNLEVDVNRLALQGGQRLLGCRLRIPADPSSAAPLAAAAALLPGSHVCFEDLGLNPHRVAFFEVLREMGAQVEISALASEAGEPLGAVEVKAGSLRGVSVQSHQVAGLIDELPLLAVLGCFAEGTTQVRGAAELRRKESDRIRAMTRGLRALGAEIDELEDGFVVSGPQELRPGRIETDQDHRIAMAFLVAGLRVPVELSESASLNVSYPQFCEDLRRLTRG